MKALTLTQPWASLVALGHKTVETRSWSTHYRGPLAIHAAKGMDATATDFMCSRLVVGLLGREAIPRGAVIAVGVLVSVQPVEQVREHLRPSELAFGNYEEGRFAWFLDAVTPLGGGPIAARGSLGLWEWTL